MYSDPFSLLDMNVYRPSHGFKVHPQEAQGLAKRPTNFLQHWYPFCSRYELLEAGKLQRVVLVIMSKATSEVLERWNFNIETNSEVVENGWVT
ncbi:hypothetical protein JHK85_045877 [Glycine max]|nr:hypothetical protein JHK86_045296 [Glycine max]KAG4952010.1 hypothetical protein JHK85_045877 [Glycine max]